MRIWAWSTCGASSGRKRSDMLRKAEHLLPEVPGIRLNIGLAYFRQNEFLKAIPPFESVVHDQPDALQPRYLLGLCYFFAERWADAADTLGTALGAGVRATELSLRALDRRRTGPGEENSMRKPAAQLIKIGEGSPEFHLSDGQSASESRAI